jgi:metal-responsive CopG/Arc/MetJ family transcriptional regulator
MTVKAKRLKRKAGPPLPRRRRLQITLTLPAEVIEAIDQEAVRQARPRSQIVEFAATRYIADVAAA